MLLYYFYSSAIKTQQNTTIDLHHITTHSFPSLNRAAQPSGASSNRQVVKYANSYGNWEEAVDDYIVLPTMQISSPAIPLMTRSLNTPASAVGGDIFDPSSSNDLPPLDFKYLYTHCSTLV